MTLNEFNALDLGARMEQIDAHGIHLANDPVIPSDFFRLEQFFVEVILDPGTRNAVRAVPFTVGERYDRMWNGWTLSAYPDPSPQGR